MKPIKEPLKITTFGGLAIEYLGKPVEGFSTRKAKALFVYLACTPREHGREVLATLLWEDQPQDKALTSLRAILANLRKLLDVYLSVNRTTLGINAQAEIWLDVQEFEQHMQQGEYEAAVRLYRGDFLEGFYLKDSAGFEDWVRQERERFRLLFTSSLHTLVEDCLQKGQYSQASAYAWQWVQADPLDETSQRDLMLALVHTGQRSTALAQYEECHRLLQTELGVDPEEATTRLYEQIRGGLLAAIPSPPVIVRQSELPEGPTPASTRQAGLELLRPASPIFVPAAPRSHNLPDRLSTFIGRGSEIDSLKESLASSRLVTLTGSGGVGKTRLAIQCAREVLDLFPHGAWLVELAPLDDPGLVPLAVANVFSLRIESDQPAVTALQEYLRLRCCLLVLDNCEHLVGACARLAETLLRSCPALHILATSREALGIEGECVFRVPSLAYPDPQQRITINQYEQYEAIRLFLERARMAFPGFTLTEENTPRVAQVCHMLDGIPLAIELAAARVNLLRVEQIARRLEESFHWLLSSSPTALPRQKTLRATMDWSYNLLSEKERILLPRLAVFVGGCTLEAAEYVCAGDGLETGDILDTLTSLANKSMVVAERKQGAEARYHLLETVRQYAGEKQDTLERQGLRNHHLDYYRSFAEISIQTFHISTAERLKLVQKVIADLANFRTAVEWAYAAPDRVQSGLRIAAAICTRFLTTKGLFTETRLWLLSGLEALADLPENRLPRATVLVELGWLGVVTSDWLVGRNAYEECIQVCQIVGPDANRVLCRALYGLAFILGYGYHELANARRLAEESVEVARKLAASGLGWIYLVDALGYKVRLFSCFFPDEDAVTTQPDAVECLSITRQVGANWSPLARWALGKIAERRGDYAQAGAYFNEALDDLIAVDDRVASANTRRYLSWLSYRQGDPRRALVTSCQYTSACYEMGNRLRTVAGLVDASIFLVSIADHSSLAEKTVCLHSAAILFGAAWKALGDSAPPVFPEEKVDSKQALDELRRRMEATEFEKAWAEGQAFSLEQAVQAALAVVDELGK